VKHSNRQHTDQRRALATLYTKKRLPLKEIARRLGIAPLTVCKWLKRYGIPKRHTWHAPKRPSKNRLVRLYVGQHLHTGQIAGLLGVAQTSVCNWLRQYRIPIRKATIPAPPKTVLRKLYLGEGLSAKKIGPRFGVNGSTVLRWIHEYGFPLHQPIPPGACGVSYTANDGHIVRSRLELRVDNWLFARGILHDYEPCVPFSKIHRADFRVGSVFIEVWGIIGSQSYDAKKQWKQAQYKLHGITLVELSPDDFRGRSTAWETILAQALMRDKS